ncbi:MAG: IclR family transcriptional regulator C-terminal domain-containing protein [Chloroflexota bacterium]
MTTAVDRPPEEAAEDTSFARGLRVFLTVADRGDIRADELSALLETPLSTVYRYLRTLTEFGFVERAENGYRLGPRMRITGGPTVTSEELIRVATPILARLTEQTGETAIIARRVATAAVCLHEMPSPNALRVTMEPGTSLPLHAGAISTVLLAYADEAVQAEVIATAPHGRRLVRTLQRVARDGIARSDGADFPGVTVLAVPVMRIDGIIAAFGLLAPTERANAAWRSTATRRLREAAREAAEALSGGGDP